MVLEEILVLFFVLLAVFAAMRTTKTLRNKPKSRSLELAVSPLSGLVLGAMLTGFQAIIKPESRPPVTEELKEEGLDRQSDREPTGGWQFAEQLRQIRRGSAAENLTLRSGPRWGQTG
jgi:hypothetical protein